MRTIPTTKAPPPPAPLPPAATPPPPVWYGQGIMADPASAGVLHAVWSGDSGVIACAPPGSGKTALVVLLAATLASRAGLRVAVAAQTRDQAVEIARRLGTLDCPAKLWWARNQPKPIGLGRSVGIVTGQTGFPRGGGGVVIGTTARWLFGDPRQLAADVLIVDEAWQATYADVGALGAFAGQIVCVGDPGQISPVVTGSTTRWADSPTGPHQPAPAALLAAHGDALSLLTLPHTWRLGPATTALIQPVFYPQLPFTSRRPPEHLTDPTGTGLPEIEPVTTSADDGPTDPALLALLADQARQLLACTHTSNRHTGPLTPGDVAVVTAHVGQAAGVRALLHDVPGVLVGTANQLQGMERAAVVALHPLAGYPEVTEFATDTGRACVMLSRHRAHLRLVIDQRTPAALATVEPSNAVTSHQSLLTALGVE